MSATGPTSAAMTITAIEGVAAEWLVRRNGGLTPTDVARFETWLAADDRHRAALAELEGAWSTLSFPGKAGQAAEARRQLAARAARRKRRRFAGAGAALILAVASVVGFVTGRFSGHEPAVASSVTPRPNSRMLPDGSTVELNAGAEIAVEFTEALRAVRLMRGEALFAVTKNPARPFVVSAGGVSVRAVGTAFAVRHGAAQIDVLVTEGRVAVERVDPVVVPGGQAAKPIFVAAGGRVEVPADVSRAPVVAGALLSATEMAEALSWRGRRVEFTHTTLTDAVALFNRQNRVQIAIGDGAVGRIAISGIFWADDPESFVRLLESGFNVRASRAGDAIALRSR